MKSDEALKGLNLIRKGLKYLFIITLAQFTLFMYEQLDAKPFQLIHSESAVLNRKGSLETRINYGYEFGYIPVHLGLFQFRYGLFTRLEIGLNMNLAYFSDQKEFRVSEGGATIKIHVIKTRFTGINILAYCHYRHAFGDPIIVQIRDNPMDRLWMVSPHSDHGRDISGGLLLRNSIIFFNKRFYYLGGFTYTRLEGREYGDFHEDQKNLFTLNFSPEVHLFRDRMMFAIENIFSYWQKRGYTFTMIPQIRWEPFQYWVLEIGAAIPVAGASNYRLIAGINHEFNWDD